MSGVEAPNFAEQKSAAANELNGINEMLSGTSSLFSPARPGFGDCNAKSSATTPLPDLKGGL